MKEVYPGIFRITEQGFFSTLKTPVNIYVITGENGLIYDAGYGNRRIIRKFSKQYKEINKICAERGIENHIDRILLSHAHPDHFSGLKRLREKWGFRIILTEEMKRIISCRKNYRDSYNTSELIEDKTLPEFLYYFLKRLSEKIEYSVYALYWGISFISSPDIIIDSEDVIDINGEEWIIFRSPGHSSEHITLYNRDKGILFSGDNVMKSINVWLGPPKSDLEQYENSLKKIFRLPNLKIILPAHGGSVIKPYERINEIIEWRNKRTDDIVKILRNSSPDGISIRDLINKLYPAENIVKKDLARGWVELTLKKLEREKRIIQRKDHYYYNSGKIRTN